MKTEAISGRNPVFEALRAGRRMQKILLAEGGKGKAIEDIKRLAAERGVAIEMSPKHALDELTADVNHQGVVAMATPISYWELGQLLDSIADKGEDPFLVVLDQVEDPHNLGAILRSVDAVGAHGVIIPERRAAGVTATVAKTSAGAVEYVPVCQVTNLARAIDELKSRGIWVVGADMSGEQVHAQAALTGPLALVIGSEGKGVRRLVSEKCDFLVRLPMEGRVNSLNASVAAGILLYEALRQRKGL